MVTDATCVLLPPRTLDPVTPSLTTKIVICLSTRFGLPVSHIRKQLQQASLMQYGKVRRIDGGDVMNASKLVPVGDDRRDATYVRVSVSLSPHDYISHTMVSTRCLLIRMHGTQTDQWYLNQRFSSANSKIFSWSA
jgi:hypothetical protein